MHRFDDVALAFDYTEGNGDIAGFIVNFRRDFNVAEAVGLVYALKILDTGMDKVVAVAPVRKDVSLLHGHMLQQVIFFQSLVARDVNVFYFVPRSLDDLIKDGFAVRLGLRRDVHFRVKKTLRLEVRDQVLASFLDDFGIDSNFLIDRQQLFLCPVPHVRAFNFHVNEWPTLHVERDVCAVGAGVVIGGDKLHLGVEVIFAHQRILQIVSGVLQSLEGIGLSRANRGVPQASPERMDF